MLRHALFLFVVSTVALVSVSGSAEDEIPEQYNDCDGCWVSTIQQFIPSGTVFPSPVRCEGYRCIGSDAVLESCAAIGVVAPYVVVADDTLPYPGCCPKAVIPNQ